jgi:hypothetical protein
MRLKVFSLILATALLGLALAPTAGAQVFLGEKVMIEMSDGVELAGPSVRETSA